MMIKKPEFSYKEAFLSDGVTRYLTLSTLVSATGEGMYYVCSALFFIQVVGLNPTEFGFGLTVAWTFGFFVGVPLGHVVDKWGARPMAMLLMICAGSAIISYLFVRSLPLFILSAIVFAICSRGASSARMALLAITTERENRTKIRAFLISTLNAGLAIGAGLGGLVLFFNTETAFLIAFTLNGITYFVGALLLSFIKSKTAEQRQVQEGSKILEVLKDKPFVAVSALNTVLLLHFPLIDVALPVWVLQRTSAPIWVVSFIFLLNTTMVIFLQIRIARGIHSLANAKAFLRVAGILLFFGCAFYAFSSFGNSVWLASSALLLGAFILTFGEMYQTVSTAEISFELTPEGRHGQYQAFFGLGFTLAEAAGPLLLTSLIVFGGWSGWLILGCCFLAAALAFGPTVDWAQRVRSRKRAGEV